MKILGICGSPRKGNSMRILNAVLEKAAESNEVDSIYLPDYKIDFCDGCLSCAETNKCRIRDDMSIIQEKLISAETIVLATPVYWDDVPAILKNIIDRTNPFSRELAGKKIYIIVCGMADDTSWDRALDILLNYCSIVGMKCIGTSKFYAKYANDITLEDCVEVLPSL